MADKNEDQIANKEEFTAFLHPEDYDHMKDIVVLVSLNMLPAGKFLKCSKTRPPCSK